MASVLEQLDPAIAAAMRARGINVPGSQLPTTNWAPAGAAPAAAPPDGPMDPAILAGLDPAIQTAIRSRENQLYPPATIPYAPLDTSTIDLSGNQPYLTALGANKQSRSDASSTWLEQLKNLLLGYGSQSLAQATLGPAAEQAGKYLGSTPDESAFIASLAGADNPDTSFSTIAQLAHQAALKKTATLEDYNNRNLYYSGHFGQAQGEDAYGYQLNQANAAKQLQDAIAALQANYTGSINQANQADASAGQTAYQQEQDRAIANYNALYSTQQQAANTYAPGADPTPPAAKPAAAPAPGAANPAGNYLATPAPGSSLAQEQAAYQAAAQPRPKAAAPAKPVAIATPTIPLKKVTAKTLASTGLRAR